MYMYLLDIPYRFATQNCRTDIPTDLYAKRGQGISIPYPLLLDYTMHHRAMLDPSIIDQRLYEALLLCQCVPKEDLHLYGQNVHRLLFFCNVVSTSLTF